MDFLARLYPGKAFGGGVRFLVGISDSFQKVSRNDAGQKNSA
jgi:hypothetical protein